MPRYEFACDTCEIRFEETRPFARAAAPARCPLCHAVVTRKVIAAVPVLAGNGVDTPPPAAPTAPLAHDPGCPCCRR